MVRVKQHADDGTLNDVSRFLADIDRFYAIDHWVVGSLEILGDNAPEIEQRCGSGLRLPDLEFRKMYRGIYQTIWGRFALEQGGRTVAELEAHDSSYWVVESANPAFESFMLNRYGKYGT